MTTVQRAEPGAATQSAGSHAGVALPRRHPRGGMVATLCASAAFASSGPFAKSLLVAGWSPGSIVMARVGLAGLVLLIPGLYAVRARLGVVRRNLGQILTFGLVAVAGCQVAYFSAVQRVPVGVALLLEYLGIVLVVLWAWVRSRRAPSTATLMGVGLALAGLVFVLDLPAGAAKGGGLDPVGVAWGLVAAIGLATFYVLAAHGDPQLPPVTLAAFGMLVGALALGLLGVVGVLPVSVATQPVVFRGAALPWWLAIAEVALVAAAAAYTLGAIGARRLGATLSSFVGLAEVVFAAVFAWLLLGEAPTPVQALGGALMLGGVAAVRLGELRRG